MTYSAYITRINNVHKLPKADRLNLGECFGNQVVVGLDTKEGELGIYFPTDGRLSMGFMEANNLIAHKDPTTGERKGGYFDERGKVRTQRFLKEKSDGFYCPLTYLSYTGVDIASLQEGVCFTEINGKKICEKYVTERTQQVRGQKKPKVEKVKFPLFHEHPDTEQLAYNISTLKPKQLLVFTEKVHGTSQRTAYTPEIRQSAWGHFVNNIFKREVIKPASEYKYVCGTRRVVKDFDVNQGWYGSAEGFRKVAHDKFIGKLRKGETVYYELVGWANDTTPIMGAVDNKKLNDKDFLKKYGKETLFHYGCGTGQHQIYVYRMTITSDDGYETDYDWDTTKLRCNEMAVLHVPEITRIFYQGDEKAMMHACDQMVVGDSLLTPAHIREGVVVRVDGSRWYALKHKSFQFKVLEGIIKDAGQVDMEEAQEVN